MAVHLGLLTVLAPPHTLAADPPLVEGAGGSATLLVILLLGSLTAGLFFASPFRRRLTDEQSGSAGRNGLTGSPAISRVGKGLRPVGTVVHRAQGAADAVIDAVGGRIATQGRRLGGTSPATPLPRMLGGDIFFEDVPGASDGVPPADARPAVRSQQAGRTTGPWSTAPLTDDALRRARLSRTSPTDDPRPEAD